MVADNMPENQETKIQNHNILVDQIVEKLRIS